ncbi:hypothetical protein G3T18_02490 [Oscillatoria salina IIICB1]|nr:hypothetical protein [Oscillatoria salina IIICB1]NET88179.1 hypothetical protein [Kamptonema sp. SIO1D9]
MTIAVSPHWTSPDCPRCKQRVKQSL